MTTSQERSLEQPFATTGVKGLDHVLRGGLPIGHVYLIEGDPGTGKTTIGLQFLLDGAAKGEVGLYVTLSESKAELQGVAKSHGWSLTDLHLFELRQQEEVEPKGDYTMFHPDEVELNEVMKVILSEVEAVKPSRVVIDSLSELRLLARDSLRYRRQILALKRYFSETRKCTVLLLEDKTLPFGGSEHQLQSLAHGVIALHQVTMDYGTKRRRLEVVKMRGVEFQAGFHDFKICRGGVVIYPRLVAGEHHEAFPQEFFTSGVPELDALMGGGLDRGTATLIVGAAGTGKTSLTVNFAAKVAARNCKAAIFLFDEGVTTLVERAERLGMGLKRHAETGHVMIKQIDPAELPPGEFVQMVRNAVENDGASVVIIDSLNGYLNAMPAESYLVTQMHELLSYLNQLGVVTILVVSQTGLLGEGVKTPIDVSYLADAVVLLRYFEYKGKVKKSIAIVKKRSSAHENTIREFLVGEHGIQVGEPLYEFSGVLSGVPVYHGEGGMLREKQHGDQS